MPPLGPIKRADLVRFLRQLGFEGPKSGGKHQFMIRAGMRLRIPNPHHADISLPLLARVLEQGKIDRAEWLKL